MRVLLNLPILALFAVSGAVGIRMLLLARRTRQLPELLIGLAFAGQVFGFIPLMAASGAARLPAGEVHMPLFVAAQGMLLIGFAASTGFIWRTFRPGSGSVALAWCGLQLLLVGLQFRLVDAMVNAPADLPSFLATHSQAAWMRLPFLLANLWMAGEGLREYTMAKRRLALGLSDPVVTNRLLLWSLLGISQLGLHTVSLVLHTRGVGLMSSPAGLSVMLSAGGVASIVMILAFWPPRPYLRFIERRSFEKRGVA